MTAGWLPVHRDQLRTQRSVTSMGSLYFFISLHYYYTRSNSLNIAVWRNYGVISPLNNYVVDCRVFFPVSIDTKSILKIHQEMPELKWKIQHWYVFMAHDVFVDAVRTVCIHRWTSQMRRKYGGRSASTTTTLRNRATTSLSSSLYRTSGLRASVYVIQRRSHAI